MEFTPKNRATVQNMPKLPYAVEEALNRLRVNVSFLGSKVKKIMVISSVLSGLIPLRSSAGRSTTLIGKAVSITAAPPCLRRSDARSR